MFETLKKINEKPKPFSVYTVDKLWTDEHVAQQMLAYHLNEEVDAASRNSKFIEKSVAWMVSKFNLGPGKRICDFGCGPGLYTTRFAETGAEVSGIDFSENSLGYAQKIAQEKNLDINYVYQNYLEFESDQKFDLITMIMCDFCALSPQQRSHLLKKFNDLLSDNGSVVLDFYTLHAFAQREEFATYEYRQQNGFWSSKDYYAFVNGFKYDNEKVILDKYTIFEPDRTREIYNWLQFFSFEAIKAEFEANGLCIGELHGDIAGGALKDDSVETAVIAHKIT